MKIQSIVLGAILVLLVTVGLACGAPEQKATRLVLNAYANPTMVEALRLTGRELSEMPNPKGEGVLVYADARRPFVWLVLDNQVYALNGAAKDLTRYEPFLREAPQQVIQRSGLNPFSATEVLQIIGLGQ